MYKQKEFVYLKVDEDKTEEVVFLVQHDEKVSIALQLIKDDKCGYMNITFVDTDKLSKKPTTNHVNTFSERGYSKERVLEILLNEYICTQEKW